MNWSSNSDRLCCWKAQPRCATMVSAVTKLVGSGLPNSRPTRGELSDPRTADHVVAEIAERVEHSLGGQRNVRILVHAEEEDAHAHRHLAFIRKREERVVGGEGIPTRQGVEHDGILNVGRSRNDEAAHVDIGGHADARRIGHRVERSLLLIVEGLNRAQRVQGGERRAHPRRYCRPHRPRCLCRRRRSFPAYWSPPAR